MEDESERTQLRYAQSLADYADAGGYEAEVIFDACCTEALGISYDQAKWRELSTLSGGEQKRLALEALLRGPDGCCSLTNRTTFWMCRPNAGWRLSFRAPRNRCWS